MWIKPTEVPGIFCPKGQRFNQKYYSWLFPVRKLCMAAYCLPKFLQAMQPARSLQPYESRWLEFFLRNESFICEAGRKGIQSGWTGVRPLWEAEVLPFIGTNLLKKALVSWPISFKAKPSGRKHPCDISFIIAHRGKSRLPNLLATLQNIAAQAGVSLECIVVEQSIEKQVKSSLPAWVRYIHTPLAHPQMPWCKSWALNIGARVAEGQLLVFHDNDICVPTQYSTELLRLHQEGYQAIRLQRFVFYLDEPTSKIVHMNHQIPGNPGLDWILLNCHGGSIAVDRETYFRIGGHDESFYDWGGEDTEFFQRCMTTQFYGTMYLPFVHLYHEKQQGMKSLHEHENVGHFATRTDISPEQRITELAARHFGNPAHPDPLFVPE